jgi:phosphoserine phosphatase RsbU/P
MKKLSDCRVLLVDDAKSNLDILVEGLKLDYKLSLALNGEMALQIAARTPPDLVLLDIMMPGLDGYEVCRRLREMPETAETPIMFLSALEEVQNKTRGFEVGGNDYLTKPFELQEVKARVRSLLKAKAYTDAVKEQISSELRVARDIQMGMLPHDFGELERAYGVEFGSVLEPAREVGGDLYGVCGVGPERFVAFLGDVSGKGIPASMFMVRAISLARLLARQTAEPQRILELLNDELAADNPSGMFVTFLCAVFEPRSGRLAIANAGHCRPVLLRNREPACWAIQNLGTALGFEPGISFECVELKLNPGDLLLLYTDGVTEALNAQEECYGNDLLLQDASSFAGQSAPEVADNLLQKVRAFAHKAPQSDDIAILALRVRDFKRGAGAKVDRLELTLNATPEEVMRAVQEFQAFGQSKSMPEKTIFGLALALEECGSNIVNHGFRRDAQQNFGLTVEHTAKQVILELRDRGPEFDPTKAPVLEPDTDDERSPGGWGLQLVRRYTDEIHYAREGGENVLRLIKRLNA